MARIISIANQKGGVGKTTTNINLAAAIAKKGKKVLTIDSDPQGNTTSGYGINKDKLKYTLYELICGKCSFEQAVVQDCFENLSILPSNINLSGAEVELEDKYIFKNIIDGVKDDYDYIFIDCPPSLNFLTLNALTASDSVLVPLQCEYYALEGLKQLMRTISRVQKNLNRNLKIDGIIFTMFDSRTNFSLQIVEKVKDYFGGKVHIYTSMIPRNVRLSEAPSHGLPVILYDKRSKGSLAYEDLADEILQRGERIYE